MKKTIVSALIGAAALSAAFTFGASAESLNGKYILFVPNSLDAQIDESHVSEEFSSDDYKILLYDKGEEVTLTVEGGKDVDVRKYPDDGSEFSDFTDDGGKITFDMPDSDLYIEAASGSGSDTEAETETEAGSTETEAASDGLAAYNIYIPENAKADINMVSGDEKTFEGPHIFRTDNAVADIKMTSSDGSEMTLTMKKNGEEFTGMGDILSAQPVDGNTVAIDPKNSADVGEDTSYEFIVSGSETAEKKETEVTVDEGTVLKGAPQETEAEQTETDEQETTVTEAVQTEAPVQTETAAQTEAVTAVEPTGSVGQPDGSVIGNTAADGETDAAAEAQQTEAVGGEAETAVQADTPADVQPAETAPETAPETEAPAKTDAEAPAETAAPAETDAMTEAADTETGEEGYSVTITIPADTSAEIEMGNGDRKTITGPYLYRTNLPLSFIRITKTNDDSDLILTAKKDGQDIEDLEGMLAFSPLTSEDGMVAIGFRKDYVLDGVYEFNVDNGQPSGAATIGKLIEMTEKQTETEPATEAQTETEIETVTGKTVVLTEDEQHTVKGIGTLNVRSAPSIDGDKIKIMNGGDSITTSGKTDEADPWYKVRLDDGSFGYVKASYIN